MNKLIFVLLILKVVEGHMSRNDPGHFAEPPEEMPQGNMPATGQRERIQYSSFPVPGGDISDSNNFAEQSSPSWRQMNSRSMEGVRYSGPPFSRLQSGRSTDFYLDQRNSAMPRGRAEYGNYNDYTRLEGRRSNAMGASGDIPESGYDIYDVHQQGKPKQPQQEYNRGDYYGNRDRDRDYQDSRGRYPYHQQQQYYPPSQNSNYPVRDRDQDRDYQSQTFTYHSLHWLTLGASI
jgi:hypothetical protein